MSTPSTTLVATAIIEQFGLGTTLVVKPLPEQIRILVGEDNSNSPKARELTYRTLELRDGKSITPVHSHPAREKSYLRFLRAENIEVTVFMHMNGGWRAYRVLANGIPVMVPRGTPHALFSTGAVEIMVISSTQDPYTLWEPDVKTQ